MNEGKPRNSDFDYHEAYSRNLGWLTPVEQESLRNKRVAIAGLGGAGGVHLLTLTRLGVGKFHLADLDLFNLVNFNRQAGAGMSSLGKDKVTVMSKLALDINPDLELSLFPDGVQEDNIGKFLDGVDLYVYGLDYFVFHSRRMVYDACRQRGIPVTFAVPLGMGASLINFLPAGPSFEEYFRLEGFPPDEWPIRFLVGVAPGLLHKGYLVYPEIVDFKRQRVPSTGLACQICAGMAGTEALKLMLGRGKVLSAPHSMQFDAYSGRLKHCWRPGGNLHPLNQLAIRYVTWRINRENTQ
ncbi:MAG: ThiF family adenylyltransferase [Hydrogenophilaceae bacterium]|nr:ThiF family adenylyltransferase [Hydrogenophilaceae bacterium]